VGIVTDSSPYLPLQRRQLSFKATVGFDGFDDGSDSWRIVPVEDALNFFFSCGAVQPESSQDGIDLRTQQGVG
jgi:hypothetical protein